LRWACCSRWRAAAPAAMSRLRADGGRTH